MNRKNLPLLLMLVCGIVNCIYTFILQYSTLEKLVSLFMVLLISYCLSSILIWTVDCFIAESEKQRQEEGEVIEKGAEGQEGDQEATEEETEVEPGVDESEESASPA